MVIKTRLPAFFSSSDRLCKFGTILSSPSFFFVFIIPTCIIWVALSIVVVLVIVIIIWGRGWSNIIYGPSEKCWSFIGWGFSVTVFFFCTWENLQYQKKYEISWIFQIFLKNHFKMTIFCNHSVTNSSWTLLLFK